MSTTSSCVLWCREKLDEKEREVGKLQDDVGALEDELRSARDAHTKLVEKHDSVARQLEEAMRQEPTQCTDLEAEIDSLRVAMSQREDQQPQECPEPAAGEEDCSAVCASQLEKLRGNMQKQADGLRQRTFDAEVNADKERDRYNELERMHNATLVTLQEQKDLLNATQAILDEERDRSQAHCPECPACEQVVAPTPETNHVTAEVDAAVSLDEPTVEVREEEHREPEVEPEPTSETIDEAQAPSEEVEPVTESTEDVKQDDATQLDDVAEAGTSEEQEPTQQAETVHEQRNVDEDVVGEADEAQLPDMDWTEDGGQNFEPRSVESFTGDNFTSAVDKAWQFIRPLVMFCIDMASKAMDAMLKQVWKSKHGNKLLSFMERCSETLTSLAVKVDSMFGTALASNKDLISFAVNATIFGPPLILTLTLMRVVSVLLGGSKKSKSKHKSSKWKGPPPPRTPAQNPRQAPQPDSPRRRDVPQLQHAAAATQFNSQRGSQPPPPMMMAPPAGPGGDSPRAAVQPPNMFGNPYAAVPNAPPHMAPMSGPMPGPMPSAPGPVPESGTLSRSMSLTDNMAPLDESMLNDAPDSEAGGNNAPFVMMGNPAMGNPAMGNPAMANPMSTQWQQQPQKLPEQPVTHAVANVTAPPGCARRAIGAHGEHERWTRLVSRPGTTPWKRTRTTWKR